MSNLKQAIEAIRLRFVSLNAIQVEKAMVPAVEFDALLAALPKWHSIETAPSGRKMFVAKAFDAIPFRGASAYESDPYCVWRDGDSFARWPHSFQPTHWCELP